MISSNSNEFDLSISKSLNSYIETYFLGNTPIELIKSIN